MNTKQLLLDREFTAQENWYAALSLFRQYKSVECADFFDTTSSAGDWEGYIVQKIGNVRYLIIFWQENQIWHGGGYKVHTNPLPLASWSGEITEDDILSILSECLEWN